MHEADPLRGAADPGRHFVHGGAPKSPKVPWRQNEVQFDRRVDPEGDCGVTAGHAVHAVRPVRSFQVLSGHGVHFERPREAEKVP